MTGPLETPELFWTHPGELTTAVCSILVWVVEAWVLNEEACRCINGVNAYMLFHITNKTKREEVTERTTTFNILVWIGAN